jgi:hypothetical protein
VADRVCAYALVAGRVQPLRLTGIAGERLTIVNAGGIAVVVGRVARVPRPAAATLRRYDEVMRALTTVYASVLPVRFGTCAATVDEITQPVRDRGVAIRRNLHLVRNRVQMTIRIFSSEQGQTGVRPGSDRGRAGVRPGSDQGQTGVRPGSERGRSGVRTGSELEYGATQGTQYLRRRAADLQIPGAEPLRAAAARWVRAERRERHDRGRLVGSLYHLIARRSAGPYRRAIERAALDAGLTTIVSGPWPPYAFTE